jgi:23S rRNA pseudouridine955/2504/2580 synthase
MPPHERKVEILYENEEIIVVRKPSGLAVQPGERVGRCLVDVLEETLHYKPFLVHRLDKDTEGVILVAKNSPAAAKFSHLIESGASVKTYLAVCRGAFAESSGSIEDVIRTRMGDRKAGTLYELVRMYGEFSLVKLILLTGRTHQIRIHLAGIGNPILGDDKHGDFSLNRRIAKEYGVKKLMLFAESIRIDSRPEIEASAPLPPHFREFFRYFTGD